LLRMRHHPALLLLTAGGLAAVAGQHYDTLHALYTQPQIVNTAAGKSQAPVYLLTPYRVWDKQRFERVLQREWYTPLSEYFFDQLREPFRTILPDDRSYETYFDRFEVLRALLEIDVTGGVGSIGRFGWRWRYSGTGEIEALSELERDEGQ